MKHPKTIDKYDGTLKELSRDIVGLDYDAQVELFSCLTTDFKFDAEHDAKIGHPQVSEYLKNISFGLQSILSKEMEPLANLCREYNRKGIK